MSRTRILGPRLLQPPTQPSTTGGTSSVIGNVYGSNAFNISIIFFADLFHEKEPLLRSMATTHYVAAAAALGLMVMGYVILRSCQAQAMTWARVLTPAIPVVYIGALYAVFTLGQG